MLFVTLLKNGSTALTNDCFYAVIKP